MHIIFYKNRDRVNLYLVQNYSGRGCGKWCRSTQECDDVLRLQRDGANLDLLLRKSALKNLAVEVDPDRARLTHRVILNLKKSVYIYMYMSIYTHTHTGFRRFRQSKLLSQVRLPGHKRDKGIFVERKDRSPEQEVNKVNWPGPEKKDSASD